ncbi:Ger(x)C family spore germination protein [Bacillus cereus]|uniref:Spore gernimation protein GerK n=1 Tax=Bacillus cereus TaxID=1396 RepID=A0A9X7G5T5_BACCE|nr:Ger(x)C family spore germination protein [Bacillus cereus]PED43149.1 spore gernimation protein GerK [Bacillus cereus]PFV02856.1 spore gernimation protein GerK [Bacillus cereus]
MNKPAKLCISLYIFFLSGCWDQNLLRTARLAYSVGYDLDKEDNLIQTVELVSSVSTETSAFKNEIHSAPGHTAEDATDQLKKTVSGDLRYFKYGVHLLGKAIEKKGIYPYLDTSFRNPEHPTSLVKLISVDGISSKVLEKKKIGNILIGEYLKRKVISLEKMSVFPQESIETVFRTMLDPGKDFALPSFKVKGEEIITNGLALFHNDRITGRLPLEQSVLFVLLSNNTGESAHITQKLSNKEASKTIDYVTIDVDTRKIKRKLKITIDKSGKVVVSLKLKLRVNVIEYPKDHLSKMENREKLNGELSQELTKESKKIIARLQKSHCDAFGIGRYLIAYHPNLWKKKDWEKDYTKVKFDPKVEVKMMYSGVYH